MLGEDHVTTFIAVRSYVVNEQILVALKAAHSNSCAVDDTSTNTSTIQQQVHNYTHKQLVSQRIWCYSKQLNSQT